MPDLRQKYRDSANQNNLINEGPLQTKTKSTINEQIHTNSLTYQIHSFKKSCSKTQFVLKDVVTK